jgi:dipeptidyl aminopeptidase/acylaminoacyl peptidase
MALALDALPPTATLPPFPGYLLGKILFTSSLDGVRNRTYALDPESGDVVQLSADWPLARAGQRDAWSAEKGYQATGARNLETGQWQIHYTDTAFDVTWPISGTTGSAPAWSPLEDRIAYVSSEGGNEDIWVVDIDGGRKQQLTSNQWASDYHPSWSPDGEQIVFVSNRSGIRQLWIMNADGSNQQPLTSDEYEAWDPVWVKYAN